MHPTGFVLLITGYASKAQVPYWKATKYDRSWHSRGHVYEVRWNVKEQAYYYRKGKLRLMSKEESEAYLFEYRLVELSNDRPRSR